MTAPADRQPVPAGPLDPEVVERLHGEYEDGDGVLAGAILDLNDAIAQDRRRVADALNAVLWAPTRGAFAAREAINRLRGDQDAKGGERCGVIFGKKACEKKVRPFGHPDGHHCRTCDHSPPLELDDDQPAPSRADCCIDGCTNTAVYSDTCSEHLAAACEHARRDQPGWPYTEPGPSRADGEAPTLPPSVPCDRCKGRGTLPSPVSAFDSDPCPRRGCAEGEDGLPAGRLRVWEWLDVRHVLADEADRPSKPNEPFLANGLTPMTYPSGSVLPDPILVPLPPAPEDDREGGRPGWWYDLLDARSEAEADRKVAADALAERDAIQARYDQLVKNVERMAARVTTARRTYPQNHYDDGFNDSIDYIVWPALSALLASSAAPTEGTE